MNAANAASPLGTLQFECAAVPPRKFADNPLRAGLLSVLQSRNSLLDAVFYDAGAVSEEETPDLAMWLAREGAVIVIPPTGRGRLRVLPSLATFWSEGGEVGALAVSSVGSSARPRSGAMSPMRSASQLLRLIDRHPDLAEEFHQKAVWTVKRADR